MATDDLGSTQSFGRWLKERRQSLDLTQKELAWAAGCSLSTLRKIESDLRRPSKQVADLLASALHIAPEEHGAFMRLAREGMDAGSPHLLSSVSALNAPATATQATPRTNGSASGGVALQAEAMPASPNQPVAPTNLPSFLAAFVGREKLVERVVGLLVKVDVRLLTLTGPPGIGKTRLSVQVAARLRDHFSDGVYFVPLAPASNAAMVAPAIAQVFGVREAKDKPLVVSLGEYLRGKNLLLVLDNFEQVVDAAPILANLMQASPRLKALVTSRVPLHVYGEHEFAVPPMEVPSLGSKVQSRTDDTLNRESVIGEIEGYEAVRLFVKRSQAVRADFALRADSAEIVAEICRRLDGLPLAIELAAVRSKYYDPSAILSRLQNRLDLLTGGPQDLPPRQQTLRAAIDWSYDLLDEREKALFRQLGVFVGGFTLEATSDFGNGRRTEDEGRMAAQNTNSEIVESLADKSLVRRDVPGSAGVEVRFGMLEVIREYAWEKLNERGGGERERVERLHALYCMNLVEKAVLHLAGPEQREWLDRLEEERANMLVALRWAALAAGRGVGEGRAGEGERNGKEGLEIGLRLAGALYYFWYVRGYFSEGRQWLEEMLALSSLLPEASPELPPKALQRLRAKALVGAGSLAREQADYGSARMAQQEALSLYRQLGDRQGIATALTGMGVLAFEQGEYSRAQEFHEESLVIWRELGDKGRIGLVLTNLGLVAQMQGDTAQALLLHQESLVIRQELGDKRGIALALNNLGLAKFLLGDYESARTLYSESLAIRREIGNRWGIASSLSSLGNLALLQGDEERACFLYKESLLIQQEIGNRRGLAWELAGLAGVAAKRGQAQLGARLLGVVDALWQAVSALPDAEDRLIIEHVATSARAELGDEAFERERTEGERMSVEEAISLVMAL